MKAPVYVSNGLLPETAGGACLFDRDCALQAADSALFSYFASTTRSTLRLGDAAESFIADPLVLRAIKGILSEDANTSPHAVTCHSQLHGRSTVIAIRRLESLEGPLAMVTFQFSENLNEPARDALTGLRDRRSLAAWLEERRQFVDSTSFAVLFLDLDGFKRINDEHGHTAGDCVLQQLTARWSGCIRDADILARYGGDEFVVLLRDVATAADAEPAVRRLREMTCQPIQLAEERVEVTATIGVAVSGDRQISLNELIAEADRDMYARKRAPARMMLR